jgi:Cu(I)/Ag(I) efflux system membrane fusion protein
MRNARQIVISVFLIVAAIAVVIAWQTRGDETPVVQDLAGHDHAAMAAAGGDELRPVSLDPESARRIGVTFAVVTRKPFRRTVSTVGNVTWDETRLVNVNPKIEGWVEQLHVDFTGAPVTAGQPLISVYSPMLVTAQEELILARRLAESVAGGAGRADRNASDLIESARRRLQYWDVPDDEIARIEREGVPRKTLTLRAPASGIVVEKNVVEGARIMPGMDLYRIADLSRVWVEGEVFEKDLSLVRLGQHAQLTFEAYPGEAFGGAVTYVYPTVSVESRTGRVRVELANPGLRLKPGMYARLELAADEGVESLMIPRSAVHYTGERTLVFLRDAEGMLVPREITTGLTAGQEVQVLAGLVDGDVVVSSANFLIDAESNMGSSMQAMPGMEGGSGSGTMPAGSAVRDDSTMEAGGTGHEGHESGAAPAASTTGHEEH